MRQLEELKRIFTPAPDMKVILAFQGSFSQEMIVSMGEVLKHELLGMTSEAVVNKTFGVFVEMAQNVMHYSCEKKPENTGKASGQGSILIAHSCNNLLLVTSNLVSTDEMDEINKRFKEINHMDRQELKNIYLIKRRQQYKGTSTGAGLGLLDIARRSSNPLGIGFLPEGKGKVRFFFRVVIPV